MMIYHCPFCGGRAPKSHREKLFQRLTEAEKIRLCELTKNLRTIQDVTAVFGEPNIRHPIGSVVTTPERDGKPETTQNWPRHIYTQLSQTADVYVDILPTDKVVFSFRGKAVVKKAE